MKQKAPNPLIAASQTQNNQEQRQSVEEVKKHSKKAGMLDAIDEIEKGESE